MAVHLPTTKSQTLSLLLAENSSMRQQCEEYRRAVNCLSAQVDDLTKLVLRSELQAQQREESWLKQLQTLQKALPDGLNN